MVNRSVLQAKEGTELQPVPSFMINTNTRTVTALVSALIRISYAENFYG
jgi:hypothetical protein